MSRTARPSAYSEIQREVGARIRWAREMVEPNRAKFARACHLDRTTVQKIEDGERPPSIFNVIDFAYKLRVSVEYILRGSMLGVDAELADMLLRRHPELLAPPGTQSAQRSDHKAPASDTIRLPSSPTRAA